MAGSKFLTAGDAITQGDLAGSTYGDPVIANGAVTNGKLANPSLSVNTDGTTLTGGGSVALGGSTTLGVTNGGIDTAQLHDSGVTNAKLANPTLSVNTDGTTLIGGGSIALGGSNSSPIGVAPGGIGPAQLASQAVTTSKFDPSAQAPDSAKLGGASPSAYGGVLSGRVDALTTTGPLPDFGAVSGISNATADASGVTTLSPNRDLKARDLSIQITAEPGVGAARFFQLYINNGPTDLGCEVPFDGTTCAARGSVDVPANSTLALGDSVRAFGVSAAHADALFGLRLTNS